MADAYGIIIVCGDYEGDLNAICDVLNSLDMTNDDARFAVYENEGIIGLDSYEVQYPTLSPCRDFYVLDDGRRVFFDEADQSIIDEWEQGKCLSEGQEYTLEQLSALISPHLTKGAIEFMAVAHEKCRYAYCERLVIRSDGSAERRRYHTDIHSTTEPWSHDEYEQYDPRVQKQAA